MATRRQMEKIVDPYDKDFSGFVFKIQANMDPRHRDRIAFVRIVSGEFERGMSVNLPRTGKGAKLSNVTQFMAESRENVEQCCSRRYHRGLRYRYLSGWGYVDSWKKQVRI